MTNLYKTHGIEANTNITIGDHGDSILFSDMRQLADAYILITTLLVRTLPTFVVFLADRPTTPVLSFGSCSASR